MADTDVIRKAVELADGIGVSDSGCVWIIPAAREYDDISYVANYLSHDLPQWLFDVIAAQLVRQVDALECSVETTADESFVFDPYGAQLGAEDGPDRTMNTIKAIVDSGVLRD